MYYMLLYEVANDFINRRAAFREEHLGMARKAKERGELFIAGALSYPVDGAALVFRTEDRAVPERFAENDPLRQGRTREKLEGPDMEHRHRRRMKLQE
jgi:uncharacterized protein YciI